MTSISPELLASYAATDYTVETPTAALTVHIGEYSAPLAQLHAAYGVTTSAMITAFNPYSQPRSDADNAAANARLFADLAEKGWPTLPAHGVDPGGSCAPEEGAWIAGITFADAFALSCKYQQNAFVFADAAAVPRLGLCT